MLRIGHIIPNIGNNTGTGNAVYSLVKSLGKFNIQIFIYTEESDENMLFPSNIRVIYYKPSASKHMKLPLSLYSRLILNQDDLDYLQLHAPFTIYNLFLSRFLSIPYIYTPHGCLDKICLNRKDKRIKKLIYSILFEKSIVKKSAGVMVSTVGEKSDVLDFSYHSKIEIVHFPLTLEIPKNLVLDTFRKSFNLNNDEFIVLFVGRWDIYTKGLDLLVEASAQLKNKIKNYKCVFVGYEVNDNLLLHKLIKDWNLEDICVIAGKLYGEKKFEALIDCNVYCQPSRYESFGMSIIEAIQTSPKVVITKNCKISNYVSGVSNVDVIDCNVDSIIDVIWNIYNDKNESTKINKLDVNELISPDKNALKAFNFYNSLKGKESI